MPSITHYCVTCGTALNFDDGCPRGCRITRDDEWLSPENEAVRRACNASGRLPQCRTEHPYTSTVACMVTCKRRSY